MFLSSDRRVPYNIPSDWRALWFSNIDELQRVSDANDNNTVSNVTVQLGGTAFLHCKVRNLADRTVSDAEVREMQLFTLSREIFKIKKKGGRNGAASRLEFSSTANWFLSNNCCVSFDGCGSALEILFLSHISIRLVKGNVTWNLCLRVELSWQLRGNITYDDVSCTPKWSKIHLE